MYISYTNVFINIYLNIYFIQYKIYNLFIYDDSPVVLLINCKISGRLVTIPDPLGKKSLETKKYCTFLNTNIYLYIKEKNIKKNTKKYII